MNRHYDRNRDPVRSRMRTTLATIQNELNLLTARPQMGAETEVLRTAFVDLVNQLDLGPEPRTRLCPYCGHHGREDAKSCGYCWRPFVALGPE